MRKLILLVVAVAIGFAGVVLSASVRPQPKVAVVAAATTGEAAGALLLPRIGDQSRRRARTAAAMTPGVVQKVATISRGERVEIAPAIPPMGRTVVEFTAAF